MNDKKFTVHATNGFWKEFEKLSKIHQKMVADKIAILEEDPFYPSLRSKKLKGKVEYFECSVNMDIRIIWYFEGEKMIIMVDVGHHDILKKY